MLQIKELTIKNTQQDLILVDSLSCVLNESDKIAIIGNEGIGKSTLLKVIKGIELPYISLTGNIARPNHIGYLEQDLETVWGHYILEEYMKLNTTDLIYINEVHQLSRRLDFNYKDLKNRKIESFSGGEKVKIGLIKALLNKPDLLLLDEPSNDLDLETLIFLESFLQAIKIPILFISHDQRLLENLSNGIIHLQYISSKNKTKTIFSKTNYKEYKNNLINKYKSDMMVANKQRSDYNKRMAKFQQIYDKVAHKQNITKNDYIGELLKRKIKSLKSQESRFLKEKSGFIDIPEKEDSMNIFFDIENKNINKQKIIANIDIKNFKLKNNEIIKEIKLIITGFDKVAIIGKNGVGKTTFLKYVYQNALNQGIKVGYLSQNYYDVLDIDLNAVDFIMKNQDKYLEFKIRQILGSLGLKREEMFYPIKKLSEGTKLKVILLLLVSQDLELLILDEPTRNLSPINQDELYELFTSFQGAIIAVTHDRAFLESAFLDVYEMTKKGLFKLAL